jgi:hypothetical protein
MTVGWDTQLVARQAGAGASPLEVDAKFSTSQKEYLLLWRNSEKPPAPFNLTPFAVTLVSSINRSAGLRIATDASARVDGGRC